MRIYNEIDKILGIKNVYSIDKNIKDRLHKKIFNILTKYHFKNCKKYKNILTQLNYKINKNYQLYDLPFMPVSVFKNLELISTEKKNIIKTMNSSGTTNKNLSKIYLDKQNTKNQIKALSSLFSNITDSKKRLPMLIIDSEKVIKNRNIFSARAAAINGFSIFSNDVYFALNDDMSLNFKKINEFYNKYKNVKSIIFGFTSIIWEKICENSKINSKKYNFKNSLILHGGGWKKLESLKVSNSRFKRILRNKININRIINYYGMVEQTGSIFFECSKCQNFITSIFSDIVIRDKNFKDIGSNKIGLVQLFSVLPTSYPGHNILTEDLGIILNKNKCKSNHKNVKTFKILGRLKKSEIRGCSDAIN